MTSPSRPVKPYDLQFAERVHNTTGKENLPTICVAGFALEYLWNSTIEQRFFKTPAPMVKKAMVRAAIMWPSVFVVTSAAISWAAWRVDQEPGTDMKDGRRESPDSNHVNPSGRYWLHRARVTITAPITTAVKHCLFGRAPMPEALKISCARLTTDKD
ncbi:hypothetical protein GGS20DRAFT_586107 [Poronia punctata]|nr:hypothetical protein GGS20DRAFT_586107 [Poronia punctata]